MSVRTYVVTGAASGIGRATKERLERDGGRVIGVDLRDAEVLADLSTPAGREQMAQDVRALVDSLDGVVACAGIDGKKPAVVSVNFFGAVATLEGLRELLARADEPRAVVVSSMAGLHLTDEAIVEACLAGDEEAALAAVAEANTQGHGTIYSSSKRAISRWVRREAPSERWAGAGIPLNAIAPGIINTPMTQWRLDDPDARKVLDERVPMPIGRLGTPDEVAALLAWLAGPENCLLVGQQIFIDGGADAVLRGDKGW